MPSLVNSAQLQPPSPVTWVPRISDKYISLLKSNSISDALIEEHKLKNVYKKATIQELRDQLADHTRFQVLKGGLISISGDRWRSETCRHTRKWIRRPALQSQQSVGCG